MKQAIRTGLLHKLREECSQVLAPALLTAFPLLEKTKHSKNSNSTALAAELRTMLDLSGGSGDAGRGDFSTALPLKLARLIKRPPNEIAISIRHALEQYAASAQEGILAHLTQINVAAPGFINLTLSDAYKKEILGAFLTKPQNTPCIEGKRKILLEYISANPTGPLHIGHGRWAAYGSVLAKILRFAGHGVMEEFYVNDRGKQISLLHASVKAIRQGEDIPPNGYHGEYLKSFAHDERDPVSALLSEQQATLHSMRVLFTEKSPAETKKHFFHESRLSVPENIDRMLAFLEETKLSFKKDGAIWFAAKKMGHDDKDRVIVKSDGTWTYFFMDILYHFSKLERGYMHLIDILGADHHGYKERITIASRLLYLLIIKKEHPHPHPHPFRMDVLIGQLVSLTRHGKPIKMSKRTGTIITVFEVMQEIGVDALRYFLLQQSITSPLEFDLEQAKAKTMDNPVYYIQYAHARIASVFKKAEKQASLVAPGEDRETFAKKQLASFEYSHIKSPTVEKLWYKVATFKDELDLMAESYEVHHLPRLLHELSALFHKLYNETPFITEENEAAQERSRSYLVFLAIIAKLLSTGLDLMAISCPEKM